MGAKWSSKLLILLLVLLIQYSSAAYLPTNTPTRTLNGNHNDVGKINMIPTDPPPPPVIMEKRNPIWRDGRKSKTYPACKPLTLSEGSFVYKSKTVHFGKNMSAATFTPLCKNGRPITVIDKIPKFDILTSIRDEWKEWVHHTDDGGFHSSLSPLLYSLSSSTVICVLLNLVIFDGPRRPFLQKFSISLSSIYLLTTFIFATCKLQSQYYSGYQDGISLRYELETLTALNILHVIFDTILLAMEVQTLMSLFPRQKEKRLIFWVGGTLIIISQVLWSVSVFDPNSNMGSSPLPAFVYLFQISISVLYAGCVIYYTVTKYKSALHRRLIFFTLVSHLASFAPIALFIVDVGGWWVVEWTDSVSWLTSILSIITVWEWARRVEVRERHREKTRVLGRQVFEDEAIYSVPLGKGKKSRGEDEGEEEEEEEEEHEQHQTSNDVDDDDDDDGTDNQQIEMTTFNKNGKNNKQQKILMRRTTINNTPLDGIGSNSGGDEESGTGPPKSRFKRRQQIIYQNFRKAIVSPFIWISDQIIELGYFGINNRDSKSPDEMYNHEESVNNEPVEPTTTTKLPRYHYPAPQTHYDDTSSVQ